MQKLVKRSLAGLLALLVALSMMTCVAFADEEVLTESKGEKPFTKFDQVGVGTSSTWAVGCENESAETDPELWTSGPAGNGGLQQNSRYIAQEFSPATDKIGGVKLQLLLTGQWMIPHVEIREVEKVGEFVNKNNTGFAPTGKLIGTALQYPVYSRGNGYFWYEFDFAQDLTVEVGKVYAVVLWLDYRVPGNTCLIKTGGVNAWDGGVGRGVYTKHMWQVDGEGKPHENTKSWSYKPKNCIGFEILGPNGMNALLRHNDTPWGITAHVNLAGVSGTTFNEKTEGEGSAISAFKTVLDVGDTEKANMSMRVLTKAALAEPSTGLDESSLPADPDDTLHYDGINLGKIGAKYICMDIYLEDVELTDLPEQYAGLGSATSWDSVDGGWITDQSTREALLAMKPGWNTIVFPIPETALQGDFKLRNIRAIRFDLDNSETQPIKVTGDRPRIGIDNVRLLDEEAVTIMAVTKVMEMIEAIPAVNASNVDEVEALIAEAEEAYQALTKEQQPQVTNYGKLAELQNSINDAKAAAPVEEKINAIPTVSTANIEEAEAAITEARKAFDELTEAQQALVTVTDKLTNAEAALANAKEAKKVEDLIAALPEISFDNLEEAATAIAAARAAANALTDDQRYMVSGLSTLADKEKALADYQGAKAVVEAIEKLPEADKVTAADKEAIEAAAAAYGELTNAGKELVENADKLTAATAALENLLAAEAVVAEIEALPAADKVTAADKEAIEAAKANFDKLTDAQKALVTNKDKLDAAVKALEDALAVKLGDVNNDGKVDAVDALEVLRFAVHKVDFTEQQQAAANVNKDAGINAADALEILKKAVGKPACF